ncbi:MAG: SLBB domain-containing protein [Chloroherpetonaceae bacterium]|nr:SLBB domain-containing protein [Chthonomonadaceae bacterium]MDW8208648.1 SLBB domain-containing protein [Chloroherpetonaceae bacterium]
MRIALTLLILLTLFPGSVADAQEVIPRPDPDVTPATRIVAGCTVCVIVTGEPDLSGTHILDEKGDILFSLADTEGENRQEWRVSLKGKTTEEARAAITESLKKYLRAPEVTVVIVKLPRVRVDIVGPVDRPGPMELKPGARLSDALARCGYRPTTDLTNVRILRPSRHPGGKPETLIVDVEAYGRGEHDDDPPLQSGDRIVLIARQGQQAPKEPTYVRIIGEVEREVQHPLTPGLRVKDLFERAGGLKPTADREKIRLVRGADGKVLELDADKVEADDPVYNLPLAPNDLIIVGVRDQSRVFAVLGEVAQPSTFSYRTDEKVTLLTAIERAGGPTRQADLRKGLLRRNFLRNPAQASDIPFDLEQVKKGKQPDYVLEPGDAVLLPPRVRRPGLLQQFLPLVLRFFTFGF